jgi:hypothetical protein
MHMLKKNISSYSFITIILLFSLSTALFFYQIYMTKKIVNELSQIQQTRIYYIQFLNAVTMHLKKKTQNQ